MVYYIGLTGNVASGKSTAAQLFSNLGVNVISADKISKELTAINQDAFKKITEHFGAEILLQNGELDRKRLRDLIFSNANQRKWLENLLHPLIRKQLQQQANLSTSPYCIIEIPLAIDKEQYPYLNKILLVSAPIEMQIARVIARDNCSREEAMAILSAQPDINSRLKAADDVLINSEGLKELNLSVKHLHLKYLNELSI